MKSKTNIYKIVRVRKKKHRKLLYVARISLGSYPKKYMVYYETGAWADIPFALKKSKLFGFKTKKDALKYYKKVKDKNTQLWLAHAINVFEVPNLMIAKNPKDFKKYWKRKFFRGEVIPAPKGTVLCDTISLNELIRPRYCEEEVLRASYQL